MDTWRGVSAQVLKEILRCPGCYQFPTCIPVYMCRYGHHICGMCYTVAKRSSKPEISSSGDNHTCAEPGPSSFCGACGSELTGTRNLLAEKLLHLMVERKGNPLRGVHSEPTAQTSSQLQNFEDSSCIEDYKLSAMHQIEFSSNATQTEEEMRRISAFLKTRQTQSRQDLAFDYDSSSSYSHMPVHCPMAQCNRSVAVTAITSHFSFEHPEIPMLSVDPKQESRLQVSPGAIPYDIGRCVTLLLLSRKQRFPENRTMSSTALTITKLKTYLPLPILTARLRINDELKVGKHGYLLLIWVANASNEALNYTVEATNSVTNTRSLKYSGPIGSLRDSQNPMDVYSRGDCLVINPGLLFNLMPDDGVYDVNIIIH